MGIASSTSRRLLHRPRTLLRFPWTKTQVFLPDEIIFDILSRIPVKSLCRFRCVSKEWYTLISDPAFIAMHKSLAEPLLAVGSSRDKSLQLIDMDGNVVKVIGGMGYIWKLISTSRDNLVCTISESYDIRVVDIANGKVLLTCRKNGLLGFGCTVPSSVYKVVYMDVNVCEILAVGDGAGWRRMQLPPTDDFSYSGNPVVVNGVLHLMLALRLDGDSVLCFDLASEEWTKVIKGPPNVDLQKSDPWLSELNGSLCMVQPDVQSTNQRCTNIWLLDNSNKSTWVKVCAMPWYSSRLFRLIPLRMSCDGTRLLLCRTLEGSQMSMVQIYDASGRVSIDGPKRLAGINGTNFSPCSLHLGSFV